MNFRKFLLAVSIAFGCFLISCSGQPKPPGPCTVNCPGGNATLSLTLVAAPLTPPPGTNLLSFRADLNTITLSPSSGAAVNVPLNSATFSVDLTRLTGDSAFLGTSVTVPAGTYSSIAISLSNPVVTFCTQTQGATGCAAGSVATVTGASAAPSISSLPFPLTLSTSQKAGLAIQVNL